MKKLFFASLTAITLVLVLNGHAAYAAPTPEGCFEFDSATKTITGYYNNEANNPANPACSRDVEVPSSIGGGVVVSIGNYAFNYRQLASVTIPNSVTSIGDGAFSSNQLTSVTIPNSVTSIGDWAFTSNQLATVTIPNSVTSIGDYVFGSNRLTTLTLGNSVTSIGYAAFSNNQLTSVTIPNSVTSIGYSAFAHNQLTTLTLGNNLTNIGDEAFAFSQLTSVTLPNSVTSIGDRAFAYQSASQTFEDDLYSGDPVKFQSALDSIILVKLYTADLSNPAGLKDSILVVDESIRQDNVWADCDAANPCPEDFNGDDDMSDTFNLGGYIVNPASVMTTYKNQSGVELAPSAIAISSNPAIKSYSPKDIPLNIDLVNGSTTNTSSYYRLGQDLTLTAPTIAGYSTISPSSPHTSHLAAVDNTVDFVYSNLPQPIADVVAPTSGVLASTGVNVWAALGGAVILTMLGGLIVARRQ